VLASVTEALKAGTFSSMSRRSSTAQRGGSIGVSIRTATSAVRVHTPLASNAQPATMAVNVARCLSPLGFGLWHLGDLLETPRRSAGLIPFVGAGLSRPFGYPEWGAFLRAQATVPGRLDRTIGSDTESPAFRRSVFRPSPRRLSANDRTASVGRRVDDPLLLDDRVDQSHLVRENQARQLRLDGRNIAGLDFDQQIVTDDIDHESANGDFESISRPRVPLLQRSVQRLLVQQTDS
jgi:hypothetical protein